MPDDLNRILRNAGIPGIGSNSDLSADVDDIMSHDEAEADEDARDEAKSAREAKITKMIESAFKRCGLTLSDEANYPILYNEEFDREATVKLDYLESFPLSALAKLLQTGLADDFKITGGDEGLSVEFAVSAALDQAVG